MKILFHHRTVAKDGQAVHIEELTSALRRLGHEVIIVGPPVEQEREDEGGFVATLKSHLPKALYELLYELNNRPAWLPIPLAGILNL